MTDPHWETFEHGADIGVRGIGRSLTEAFAMVGLAVTGVVTDPPRVNEQEKVSVSCVAKSKDLLLLRWLNALISEMDIRNMVFGKISVEIEAPIATEYRLSAILSGEKVDSGRHDPAVLVKGASLTALEVRQQEDGLWIAQCIVDV